MTKELKKQLLYLMHDIMFMNQDIMKDGEYKNLTSLCKQDITILNLIDEKENLTAKEISNLLLVPKTTIVTAVSRLVNRDYIVRISNEKDRREFYLQLTEKGKRANFEHVTYENKILKRITDCWNEEDQRLLTELLSRRTNELINLKE